jgi:hypothetical protein
LAIARFVPDSPLERAGFDLSVLLAHQKTPEIPPFFGEGFKGFCPQKQGVSPIGKVTKHRRLKTSRRVAKPQAGHQQILTRLFGYILT